MDTVEDVVDAVVIVDIDIDDIHLHPHLLQRRDLLPVVHLRTVHALLPVVLVHLGLVHRVHHHRLRKIVVVVIAVDVAVEVHLDRIRDIDRPHPVHRIPQVRPEVREVDLDRDVDHPDTHRSISMVKAEGATIFAEGMVEVELKMDEIFLRCVDEPHPMTILVEQHRIEISENSMEIPSAIPMHRRNHFQPKQTEFCPQSRRRMKM